MLGRQRAKRLADRSVLVFARHGRQHALGMIAERGGKGDLLLGRRTRGCEIGSTEALDQPLRQQLDGRRAVLLARLDDLHQRRPAERVDAEKARAKRRARLAFQRRRIEVRERERPRDGPFAGLGGLLEHEGIGRIEPDGAQQLHVRGPPVAGSSHDGTASAAARSCRSGSFWPRHRTSRSPLRSSAGIAPFSVVR